MKRCRIYLIRHTQTTGNVEKRLTGRKQYKITKTGKKYIKLLTDSLKNVKFDKAYSSTSFRAEKTIQPLAKKNKIPIHRDQRLCEMYFGIYDGWKWEKVNKINPQIKEKQNKLNIITGIPKQESMAAVSERMYKCIKEIAENNLGKTVLIGSHGIAIEEFLRKINNVTYLDEREKYSQLNTAINEIYYENGEFEITRIADISHLKEGEEKVKFSIIIPAYNAEKTINRAIDSVHNQTFKNYEIIIVDDDSSDKTSKVIKRSAKVHIIKNAEQLKAGGSRNVGIKRAKGEYILFLDADDYLADNNVLRRIDESIGEKIYDMLYLGFQKNVDGELKEKYMPTEDQVDKQTRLNKWEYPNVWDICWNREFILKHDLEFVEKKYIAEDALFYYQSLMKAHNIKVTDVLSHIYVIDSKSKSATTEITFEKMNDFYYMISEAYKFADTLTEEYKIHFLDVIRKQIDYANKLSLKLEEQYKKI